MTTHGDFVSIPEILAKKRDAQSCSAEDISFLVRGLMDGTVADYQLSAFLMAGYIHGLNTDETAALTDAMLKSGKQLSFAANEVVDKHSTGGVGDKASFVLAPLAAACGVKVPMISGRGLGHTGGTLDKLEAIPGFNTQLTQAEFQSQTQALGLAIIGQTADMAPADKKIYALRDVTATVSSIPFITASIMSKKLSAGLKGLTMDIKVGSGAFMKDLEKARALALSIKATAERYQLPCHCLITDMHQPLGIAVGHSLELQESIDTLRGQGPQDLTELSLSLAGSMIWLASLADSHEQGIAKARQALEDGRGLKMLQKMIVAQGGEDIIARPEKLPIAAEKTEIKASSVGYLTGVDAAQIGLACTALGGGRQLVTDSIDHSVGLYFHKKIGDQVKENETMVTIFHHSHQSSAVHRLRETFLKKIMQFSEKPCKPIPLIFETLGGRS